MTSCVIYCSFPCFFFLACFYEKSPMDVVRRYTIMMIYNNEIIKNNTCTCNILMFIRRMLVLGTMMMTILLKMVSAKHRSVSEILIDQL
jgi:hypothetical protein